MLQRNLPAKLLHKVRAALEEIPFIFIPPVPAKDFLIVAGADTSHYKSLKQFLSSLFLHEPEIKILVFDLGFTEAERLELQKEFKKIELRVFEYSKYPDYFNIKIHAGEYAWKPAIIADILNEFKCSVCWMDAGNIVLSPLTAIRKIMNATGFYSPHSRGIISDWTHPKTLRFLKASIKLLSKRNLNGACVAVNYKYRDAKNTIDRWKECALIKDCIAPVGSSRENHRQDQAVLSILAHQAGITKNMPREYHGFITHKDIN